MKRRGSADTERIAELESRLDHMEAQRKKHRTTIDRLVEQNEQLRSQLGESREQVPEPASEASERLQTTESHSELEQERHRLSAALDSANEELATTRRPFYPLVMVTAQRETANDLLAQGDIEGALDLFERLLRVHRATRRGVTGLRAVASALEPRRADDDLKLRVSSLLVQSGNARQTDLRQTLEILGRRDDAEGASEVLASYLADEPEIAAEVLSDWHEGEVSRDFARSVAAPALALSNQRPDHIGLAANALRLQRHIGDHASADGLATRIDGLLRPPRLETPRQLFQTAKAALVNGNRGIAQAHYDALVSCAFDAPNAHLLHQIELLFPLLGSKSDLRSFASDLAGRDTDPDTAAMVGNLLIISGDFGQARQLAEHLTSSAGLEGSGYRLRQLAAWLDACNGDFSRARSRHAETVWPATDRWYASLGSDTLRYLSNDPRSPLPHAPLPDDAIPVLAVLRDEIKRLPAFLDHYRRLGATHFLFVDNGSSDGTADFLTKQPDVMLFRATEGMEQSLFGIRWLNDLIDRFAPAHWCVSADLDEHLVYRDSDRGRDLRSLIADMTNDGHEMLRAFMLDMYPERAIDMTGPDTPEDLTDKHRYFDNDYVALGQIEAPYATQIGGIRRRIGRIPIHPDLAKTPLFFTGTGIRHNCTTHVMPPGSVAPEGAVFLHYKFASDAVQRSGLPTHSVNDNYAHRDHAPGILTNEASVIYESSEQLARLGLLDIPLSTS